MSELESEFAKCSTQKSVPTRYLRSQRPKDLPQQHNNSAAIENLDTNDPECADDDQLDPYELAEPVNILSKLPNDFFEQIVLIFCFYKCEFVRKLKSGKNGRRL